MSTAFKCDNCDKILSSTFSLNRHIKSGCCYKAYIVKVNKNLICEHCDLQFSCPYRLNRHKRRFIAAGTETNLKADLLEEIVEEIELSEALPQAINYEQTEESLSTTQSKMVKLERYNNTLMLELNQEKYHNEELQELLFKSNMARKDLHNEVLDLKGNIRVFCRVRPPLNSELNRIMCGWQYMDETTVEMSLTKGCHKEKHQFSVDQVFSQQSSQIDIFKLVSPLIQSAFDGYNVCIFAYGQTGSGKTYTMEGSQSHIGIIPRTVDFLFGATKNYKLQGWTYAISVSFLEIYNEVLYDLLSDEQKDLEIRMVDPKTPQEITVSNLTERMVEDVAGLRELIEIAKSNRATAATIGNERSSRSHAVTQIKLFGNHNGKGEKCIGKINLIDLAGCESLETSNQMDQTENINRSLVELTNIVMALKTQKDLVPYSNSKLTHLLMPSLGGNSKTLIFINVAPFDDCFKESVNSMQFAANVKACK